MIARPARLQPAHLADDAELRRALAPQFVFDLAVDSLELSREFGDQHLQPPLAVIDDAPQLGALRV
jgi:hypothetical protein